MGESDLPLAFSLGVWGVVGEVDEREGVNSSEQLTEMQSQLQQESMLLQAHNATLDEPPILQSPAV